MNGIEKIVEQIGADARIEADAIIAEARAQAAKITEGYARQADGERAEILHRGEQQAAERSARMESLAELEGKKLLLAAKQEMIAKAFDAALEKLLSLPEEEKVELLATLCAQASVTGREEVILTDADRAAVGQRVVEAANRKVSGGKLTLSDQTRPIKGGVVLSEGGVEVNCAFDTLVRLARPTLERQVSGVLFGA